MSLLRLTPEVRRLRRVARACAAGEVSRLQYRQARRDVIDGFVQSWDTGVDQTTPRDDQEANDQEANDQGATRRRHEVVELDSEEPQFIRRWLMLFALLVVAVLASQWAFAFEIGAVKDREPNPSNSPRLLVTSLMWQVPEELDAVDPAAVDAFLGEQLHKVRAANAPLEHGFSAAELNQVGKFLDAIGVHEERTRFSSQDLQDLAALVAQQKQQRGVSVAQLEEIADELQQFVRDQGFPLARAYVPQQVVADGRVELGVLVGRLAAVQVAQSERGVATRFDSILGKPIREEELETKLNGLNRLPGMRAQASFVPGAAVGTSAMVLNVAREERFHGVVQLDNYGMEQLGEERVSLLGRLNNPRGIGDQIELSFVGSLNPNDQKRGTINYQTPLLHGRFDSRASIASVDLDWQEALGVAGKGTLFDGQIRDTRVFTRIKRREYEYLAGVHDLRWDGLTDQRSWFVGAGITGHRLWDSRKVAIEGDVRTIIGGMDATRSGQDKQFWLARVNAQAWVPWQVPWLELPAKAVLGIRGQISPDLLPTTQRIAMTGVSANRGFAQLGLMVDQGLVVRGEVLFAAPLGQFGVFLDAGYGERNNLTADWYHLTSIGMSWQARLFSSQAGYLTSKLSVATPLSHEARQWSNELNDVGVNDESTRIYWSVQYAH